MLVVSLSLMLVEAASPAWVVVPGEGDELSLRAAAAMTVALEKTGRRAAAASAEEPAKACLGLEPKAQATCLAPRARAALLLVVSAVGIRERVALTAWVVGPLGEPLEEAGDKGAASELEDIATAVLSRLTAAIAGVEARSASVEPVVGALVEGPAQAAPTRSRVVEVLGVVVGGAALVAGGVMALVGTSQAQQVNGLKPGQLSWSQAKLLEQQANGVLTASLVSSLAGLALALVSGVLWVALP